MSGRYWTRSRNVSNAPGGERISPVSASKCMAVIGLHLHAGDGAADLLGELDEEPMPCCSIGVDQRALLARGWQARRPFGEECCVAGVDGERDREAARQAIG